MSKFAKRMTNKQRKGFTLVELVVVILIIAILAAAIFLGGATVIRQARERQVMNDLRNYGTYVQDMLYDNPDLQYFKGAGDGYGTAESYSYNAKNEEITAGTNKANPANAAAYAADEDGTVVPSMPVLALLNTDYLTADFQMGDIHDAWDTPYCWSYNMLPPTATAGSPAACIIVINSLGINTLDETSNATGTEASKIAETVISSLGTEGYMSATEVVETLKDVDGNWDAAKVGDDYGVVIVMIDGQVSVDYYGF